MPLLTRLSHVTMVGALGLSSAAVLVAIGQPAYATTVPVTDVTALQTALGPGCTDGSTVRLDADVDAPAATLEASCSDLTLQLAGAGTLAVMDIVIDEGEDLTITGDPTDEVTVDASGDEDLAGIRTTGAALTIRDLHVTVTGGRLGAAIGGGNSAPAGSLTIDGSAQVDATADANAQGAAIGGGYLADGGTTTIEDDARVTVTARTNAGGAALGGGYLGDGGTIVVRDRATVVALARSGANGAAIGGGFQGDGGTLTIGDDAYVQATARSGAKAAAIGGGYQGNGGTVTVDGRARVVATNSVSGDLVGAAIGGGPGGDGADVTIDGGDVTAGTATGGAPLGAGSAVADEALVFGTLRLHAGTLRIAGGVLRVDDAPDVTEAVIDAAGRVVGERRAPATLAGAGQIQNDGSIVLPPTSVSARHLTGHHYRVVFDTRGTPAAPASKSPAPTRVFAASFADGGRAFPPRPTRPGFRFTGWNTRPNGSGVAVTPTSTLPGSSLTGRPAPVTAYATWVRR